MKLPTEKGRLLVGPDLRLPDDPRVYALGDAAAVPDHAKSPDANGLYPICPPTAQHAMRQARAVARNVVADVRGGSRRDYRHRDLGLVVDLGGWNAVARPLGVSLSGWPAKLVTRGYHVAALPTPTRKLRAIFDWFLATGRAADDVAFGIAPVGGALASSEHRTPEPPAQSPTRLVLPTKRSP